MEPQPNSTPEIEEGEMIVGHESYEDQPPLPEVEKDPPVFEIEETPQSTTNGSAAALGLIIAAAFLLGLALGFFGRPALIQDLPIQVVVTVVPNEPEAVQANNQMTETEQSTSSTTNQEVSTGPTPTIMDFVLSDARHFQGDNSAPVTIIEFSDFN